MITALVRTLVAAFVTWRIDTGSLAPAWLMVAVTDLGCAAVQGWMLRKGIAADE